MPNILAEENYQIYDKDLAMVIFQKKMQTEPIKHLFEVRL